MSPSQMPAAMQLAANFEQRLSEFEARHDAVSETELVKAIRATNEHPGAEAALAAAFERAYRNFPAFRTHSVALAFENKLGLSKHGGEKDWWSVGLRLIPGGDKWLRQSAIYEAFGKFCFQTDPTAKPWRYTLMPGIQDIRNALLPSMSEREVRIAAHLCVENAETMCAPDYVDHAVSDLQSIFPVNPWVVSRVVAIPFAQAPDDDSRREAFKSKIRTSILDWWWSIADSGIIGQIAPVVDAWKNNLQAQTIHERLAHLRRP